LRIFEFGPFRLEPAERRLRRGGTVLPLTPKALDTLLVLVENAGRAVGKDELMEKVWPGTSVGEATLAQNIFALRKALGDPPHIETVPKFGYRFIAPMRERPAAPRKAVLVVLPLENLSVDGEQEYFSDGLTDELITQLGRLNPEQLGIIARTSAMKYKLTRKTVAEIGRELGVSHVVAGTVRRAGSRVRVTAQLVDVAGQTHVWGESYDRDFDDILVLQSDIAQAIAREIKIQLSPRAAARPAGGAIGAPAHEAYLKGRYFWNKRTEDARKKGIGHFQEAIAQEPRYAAAYDGLADSYVMLACRGVLPARETFQKARTAVLKALEIDAALGEGHATLAHVRLHDWDWTDLDADFQRALDVNPSHAFAYYWYAEYLMAMGRVDESIAMVTIAHEMDPLSSVLSAAFGMLLYLARRYDEAVGLLRGAIDLDAGHFLLHFRLGLVSIQKGWPDAAIDEMQTAVALSGRSTEALTGLGQAYGAARLLGEMQAVVHELDREIERRYVSPYNMARVHATAGHPHLTFEWLERAYLERNPDLIELRSEPVFDSLRSDPRFADLLRRVGWTD
jgi:TolB-like protein